MKVAAHPLMVAVALGLLGPTALAGGASRHEDTEVNGGALDPAEIARAERLWTEARDAFDAERDEA